MTLSYKLKLKNTSIDGTTGHHRLDCWIEERAGEAILLGAVESYGIDLGSLNSQFGGEVEKWLNWIGQDMLKKHLNRMNVHREIASWEGREIPLTPPPVRPPPPPPPPAPPAPPNKLR
jgi:hypothetical protein